MKRALATGAQASDPTIIDYGVARESTTALSIDTDWLRTRSDLVSQDVRETQDQVRSLYLAEMAYQKATEHTVEELLDELAYGRGLAWSHIALLAGVSVSAVRKWRRGSDASADSRSRLAGIAALLDILEQKNVADPAQWMEMYLPLPAGYNIRPLDLYLDGHAEALLELAENRTDAATFLDRETPEWRDGRSEYEVFKSDDGERSLRKRRG